MKIKLLLLLTLIFCMSVFSCAVYASTDGENENLIVNAVWLDGETIRIDVTDPETDVNSALAVPLKDYIADGDNSEYLSIQAIDQNGKQSGVIEIKNPYYDPSKASEAGIGDNQAELPTGTEPPESVSAVEPQTAEAADDSHPFTPDGSGTVIDNANETEGKEFFTINSADGNEFYLIIDRHNNADNVYFLNAVTEEDLITLAAENGRTISGGVNTSAIPEAPQNTSEPTPEPVPEPVAEEPAAGFLNSNIIILAVVAVVVGGIAYYVKIVRPKKNNFNDNADNDDDDDIGYDEAADEDIDDFEDEPGGDSK